MKNVDEKEGKIETERRESDISSLMGVSGGAEKSVGERSKVNFIGTQLVNTEVAVNSFSVDFD